jgi:hypothetical protein
LGQIGGELEQKLHGVFEYFTIEYAIDYLLPGFGDVRLLDQSFLFFLLVLVLDCYGSLAARV